jgi:hypothetical protein
MCVRAIRLFLIALLMHAFLVHIRQLLFQGRCRRVRTRRALLVSNIKSDFNPDYSIVVRSASAFLKEAIGVKACF